MPAVKYVGPFDQIEVAGYVVKQGDSIDVDAALAKSLLDQPDNFKAAKATSKES